MSRSLGRRNFAVKTGPQSWSLERAAEVGQDAWLSGTEGDPLLQVASSRDASVSRWSVQPDGSLT